LDNGSISNFDPRFSPDGSKILFCHVSEGQGDICTINLDGSGRVCLTSGAEHDYEPVYSPDGSLIYFLRAQVFRNYSPIALPAWHDVDIYSIRADGSGLKRITFQNNYGMSNLSINSTGNTLMVRGFESETENIRPIWMIPINEPKNIKTIEPDLTNYRYKRLLLGPEKVNYAELSNPQFSPDGTHMLFTWPNRRNLFLMNIKRNLTEKIWTWESDKAQLGGMYPRFSQDGHQIIFSTVHLCEKCDVRIPWPRKETEIWLIYTDGTGLRSVEIK